MNRISRKSGFTIVELIVIIVIIGILAAITIVSYTGVSQKATVAVLMSDLASASKQVQLFQATSSTSSYPTANNCPTPGATEICIKTSGSNTLISNNGYIVNNSANPKTFSIIAANGSTSYRATNDSVPAVYTSLATTDPANWIIVGNQVWSRNHLNVGTRISGATAQTDNATLEKYCYGDLDANCTTYGGLYQWNEAMQYVITGGSQGICPAGSHIPTTAEYTTLTTYLGGTSIAGTAMKAGGVSGLNLPFSGFRTSAAAFSGLLNDVSVWSSTEHTTNTFAWYRSINSSAGVTVNAYDKNGGLSIRCLGN